MGTIKGLSELLSSLKGFRWFLVDGWRGALGFLALFASVIAIGQLATADQLAEKNAATVVGKSLCISHRLRLLDIDMRSVDHPNGTVRCTDAKAEIHIFAMQTAQ